MTKRALRNLGLVLAAVTVGTVASVYITQVRPIQRYFEKRTDIEPLIDSLRQQAPEGTDEHVWSETVTTVYNGFGNVFFHPTRASYEELIRFEKDLRRRLYADKPPTVDTLRWIWNRLGDTGPTGKAYIERFTVMFEDDVRAMEGSPGSQASALELGNEETYLLRG